MSYRIEYLTPRGWSVGHHGFDLTDPAKYAEKVTANKGTVTRCIDNETGAVFGVTVQPCPVCDSEHAAPYDGSCLL